MTMPAGTRRLTEAELADRRAARSKPPEPAARASRAGASTGEGSGGGGPALLAAGSPSRSVVLALVTGAVVFGTAHGLVAYARSKGVEDGLAEPLPDLGGFEMLVGWMFMGTVLVLFADIPATGELAVSFAWLILLAILMVYGQAAFTNLRLLMGARASSGGSSAGAGAGSNRLQ